MIIVCVYDVRNPKSSETSSLLAYFGNLLTHHELTESSAGRQFRVSSRLVLVASRPAPRTSWLEI